MTKVILFPPAWADRTVHEAARWAQSFDGRLRVVPGKPYLELVQEPLVLRPPSTCSTNDLHQVSWRTL